MIQLTDVKKIFPIKNAQPVLALNGITFTLPDKGFVFILGKSGCGKSTLLNLLGGLDAVTAGSILFKGKPLTRYTEKEYEDYRRCHIGFVFQDFHLLEDLSVGQNLEFVTDLLCWGKDAHRLEDALTSVDLAGYGKRKTTELSGGQKQRVGIARALIKQPSLILADEPTGNLDSETAKLIFRLLKEISANRLVVVVSHDEESARVYADRIIRLSDGTVVEDRSIRFSYENVVKDPLLNVASDPYVGGAH